MKTTIEFKASDKEVATFNNWLEKHDKKCKLKKKNKLRLLTYSFTPNGIGKSIIVACSCGKYIDITAVEDW